MIIIFSGPSGVGKNTVINKLLENTDRFDILPTLTTRDKRENEKEGNPYFFVSREEFEKRIENNEFYEYEKVHNNYYGTSKLVTAQRLKTNKILLKDIDVLGTLNLKKTLGQDTELVTIFLTVEKTVLNQRLINRGESSSAIELRLSRFELEEEYKDKYDYVVYNDDLNATLDKVEEIIQKSLS